MADLIFYTGPMGSAKTAHALMINFQYIDRGKKVWLIKPSIDTREEMKYAYGKATKILVRSRIGISAWADAIGYEDEIKPPEGTEVIICDEAQFLSTKQVDQLKMLSDAGGITVFCYGLRTDFQSNLFEGSRRLLELASSIQMLPVICDCGNAAVINARIVDGSIVTEGAQVDIGGDEKYRAYCYACWRRYS
jgi:thymidine kinase